MRNVLVTGAAGFLGSHLSMLHLRLGDRVWAIDDFSSSDPKSQHLARLREHPFFKFEEASTCDDWRVWPGLMQYLPKLDRVYNMACPASPPVYQEMPLHTMMTCTVGTSNVLDFAQHHGTVVVHASTSEVYGDPDVSPQPESYRGCVNPYGPRACYDEGKRAAEALCFDYRNTYGVDARLVRIFNTYGPHMDPYDGRVVSNFVCQALRGEPLSVYGEGMQTRSFCYVDDLIEGIVRVGDLSDNPGGPINLGNPCEFRVWELAMKVNDAIRPQPAPADDAERARRRMREPMPNVVWRPMPADDPTQRCPDISRARALLGWEPKVSLDEGLARTVAWFKEELARR